MSGDPSWLSDINDVARLTTAIASLARDETMARLRDALCSQPQNH
jgi:hypothetical protein